VFIKESSLTTNIKNTKNINGKLKFFLPLFFIIVFVLIRFFVSFYKKQKKLSLIEVKDSVSKI
jgi:flagellar biogenesis protein FliO